MHARILEFLALRLGLHYNTCRNRIDIRRIRDINSNDLFIQMLI